MVRALRFIAILSLPLFVTASGSASEPPLFAELEIERGSQLSRVTLYIVNNTENELEVRTGSAGGPGQYDDRVSDHIVGTPVTAVPELTFATDRHWITFSAPSFGSGITRRSMRPYVLRIPAQTRFRYYTFRVPTAYLAGKLYHGHITFPWAKQPMKHQGGEPEQLTIPVIRVASEKQLEPAESQ
jgi:hypothetical protein